MNSFPSSLEEIDNRRKYQCDVCHRFKTGKNFTKHLGICDRCLNHHEWRRCLTCGKKYMSNDKRRTWCSFNCNPATARGKFVILERDNFQCIYCGKSSIEDRAELHVDHIVPRSEGGKDLPSNLVTACKRCNLEKNNRMLPDHLLRRILNEVARRNDDNEIPNRFIKIPGRRR